jgi:hypothetical protein
MLVDHRVERKDVARAFRRCSVAGALNSNR